jgi:hypothetical protein
MGCCKPAFLASLAKNLLRLSIVGGLVSMALPGGDFLNKAERVPLAFALASPSGIKLMGRGTEAAASTFSANTGNQILNYLAKGASSNVGKAVLSQLVNKSRPKQ